jgi:hypothetical protein
MRFSPAKRPVPRAINFLDATEEEVVDLARSLVCELSIMSSFLILAPEKKEAIHANIAAFRAFLGEPGLKQ